MPTFLLLFLFLAAPVAAQSGPTVRFAGAVNQDGCPFCCAFDCQGEPTPAPEFDDQGRRVFRRSTGQFLLVVEAGLGTSGRNPGSEGVYSGTDVVSITHASGLPSLQLLAGNDLGTGTPQVDCRSEPLGGVKGFPALDFAAGGGVSTALVDMACRFELAQSSSFACTRDRFGNFAFLGVGSARQYCFQVSNVSEFPPGRSVAAVRLRDTSGNLGPRHEFVVVVEPNTPVPTATPTSTRTPTRTPTPRPGSVAGRLRYYVGDRAVPSATVAASGASARTTTSSATGNYVLTPLAFGTIDVVPRRVGGFGSPTAITALDAAHVLQVIAGTRTFDARQRLACDVTGNGSLSALDAARILQRQVGTLARFAAADQCGSDWLFEPLAAPAPGGSLTMPLLSPGACRMGAATYQPLSGDAVGQDFLAMLLGDCTGNWVQGAGFSAVAAAPAEVRLRVSRRTAAGTLRVPIAVDAAAPFLAVDLTLQLGPGLRATGLRKLGGAAEAMAITNLSRPGVVRVAVASPQPLSPGAILVLELDADAAASPDDVVLTRALVDDMPALATTGAARAN